MTKLNQMAGLSVRFADLLNSGKAPGWCMEKINPAVRRIAFDKPEGWEKYYKSFNVGQMFNMWQ